MRSFDEWDHHPQGQTVAAQPLFTLERIGEADPRPLPKYGQDPRPLTDIRVLDLTRIIAGPICGRALAAYGADVMLVNSPNLPNIDNIIDTSRGKLSVFADLDTADGRIALGNLLRSAHVFVQGYRPGAMAARGFGPQDAARIRPGIVYVSLSAYGEHGPWARRRGFDSLVQTASGFNHAEAQAAGQPTPAAAHADPGRFRLSDGLRRAGRAGASGHRGRQLACALAQTAHWLRGLGRIEGGLATPMPAIDAYLQTEASGFGELVALRHAAQFSRTPARWTRPSPPGTHPTVWPWA